MEEFFSLLLLLISGIIFILFSLLVIINIGKPLAIYVLGMIGNAWAVKHLIGFLENRWSFELLESEGMEARAARALGKTGNIQTVEPLIRALRHKYWSVREAAVEALGEIGNVRAVEPLIQTLGDRDLLIRAKAVKALGEIGDVRAVEPLIRMFEDKVIRAKAMEAVEQIGSPAVEPLIKVLVDKKSVIRSGAAEVLGRLEDGRAVKPLIKAFEDEDSGVRYNVARALDNIGWKPASMMEKVLYLLAREDREILVSLGVSAISPLTEIYEDDTSHLRRDAEIGLQKLYALIEIIVFGNVESTAALPKTTLLNPDVSNLSMSMSHLKKVKIYTETYSFHQVERFLTYAVNYIGQKHLKENVEVDIYGNPDKLHSNLRNNFEFLCKRVELHEGNDRNFT